MHLTLTPHSSSLIAPTDQLTAFIDRKSQKQCALEFLLTTKTSNIAIPPVTTPSRRDNLWHHTCFELFIRPASSTTYFEFNFSPSSHWAAYNFTDYRNGMNLLPLTNPPQTTVRHEPNQLGIKVNLDLSNVDPLKGSSDWSVGLSAIVKDTQNSKSYWALAHPPGAPDFHHADCFTARITARKSG